MFELLCVIEKTPKQLICFDSSYATFAEFKERITANVKHTVVVKNVSIGTIYAADLSKLMLQKAEFNLFSTWTDVLNFFTSGMLNAYSVIPVIPSSMLTIDSGKTIVVDSPIATTTNLSPKIISESHSPEVRVGYGLRTQPEVRDEPSLKSVLTDLVFTHTNIGNQIVDFSNCIPVVSGKVHYPVMFGNDLFAVDGALVLKSQAADTIANVLIDFTPLGGMETVRLSDCTKYTLGNGVAFDLPEGTDLIGKTALLVVAGRIFFPHEFHTPTQKTVAFNPQFLGLSNIRLANKVLTNEYISGTNLVRLPNDVDYIASIDEETHYESFIILVNNTTLTITESKPLLHIPTTNNNGVARMFRFPKNTGGIMVRKMTREICDYFRQFDDDVTTVMIAQATDLNRITVEDAENNLYNVGYKTIKPDILENHSISQEDDGYVIYDIIAREGS